MLLLLTVPGALAVNGQAPVAPTGSALIQLMTSQPSVDLSAPVTATAAFDPPVARAGAVAVYRVRLNALESAIRWPEPPGARTGQPLRPTAHGQVYQAVAGGVQPFTTFNFVTAPLAPGRHTVPEYTIEVNGRPVAVPAATVEAVDSATGTVASARRLILQPALTNVFVGQTFAVRLLLPPTGAHVLEALTQVQLNGAGFLEVKGAARQAIEPLLLNGRPLTAYVYDTSAMPLAAGDLELAAQGYTAGNQFIGPIVIRGQVTIPGGPPQYVLLDADPVVIHVRPLPVEGARPGFMGAIGAYACDRPQLSTNVVAVGDPVQLRVTLRGAGDVGRLAPPLPPAVPGWQIFPAQRTKTAAPGIVILSYTLIPLNAERHATPAIPFSFFNPATATYEDLTLPPVPIKVLAGPAPTGAAAAEALLESLPAPERKPALSRLAAAPGRTAPGLDPPQRRGWFWWLQLGPAAICAAAWGGQRRRRFLAAHPDVVRRRRARRAVRRARRFLRRAAAAGDARAFTQGAVQALTAACAPHFPAEPRALVGRDVLAALGPAAPAGQADTVRRFFAAADAGAFSAAPWDPAGVLAMRAELERVLTTLEERL